VQKSFENIAGVEVPIFEAVHFVEKEYAFLTTPAWVDAMIEQLRNFVKSREKIHVMEERKRALEHELREVSIRVNLFEKILIPRCRSIIKKIQLFLGEQQLVAVSQAKVAKAKILARKEA
jgi:V/A-type H+-transporting ATPase subunit D